MRIQDVTQEIADGLGLKSAHGALIAGVEPKGPAANAHLQTGDVIQSLNGKDIDGRALPRLVAELAGGSVAHLGIWRKGQQMNINITIGALPEEKTDKADNAHPAAKNPAQGSMTVAGMGFTVGEIDDIARQKYNMAEGQKGVLVTGVTDDSPAAERGLRPGDVVTEVQQAAVNTPTDLRRQLDAARTQHRKTVLFLVQNADGLRWVPFPLPEGSGH